MDTTDGHGGGGGDPPVWGSKINPRACHATLFTVAPQPQQVLTDIFVLQMNVKKIWLKILQKRQK